IRDKLVTGVQTCALPICDIDQHDVADHQNMVLISQAGAKKVFGNENPIGKTLLVTSGSTPVEIVGVVGDVRSRKVAEPNDMEFRSEERRVGKEYRYVRGG